MRILPYSRDVLAWVFVGINCSALVSCKTKVLDLRSKIDSATDMPQIPTETPADVDQAISKMPDSFYKPATATSGSGICTDNIVPADSIVLPEKRLTDSFLFYCSGCHGTAGEGRAEFPTLGKSSKEAFVNIVRKGGARMPSFPSELISDTELSANFDLVSSQSLKPFDSQVSLKFPLETLTDDQYGTIMTKGLVAWRTPGERGACISCHGPDGIDLARIDYPASSVLRRALGQGLPNNKSMDIVRMISAQRARYKIDAPCRSVSFIPLQPAGKILSGNTSEAKDQALLDSLKDKNIELSLQVESVAEAKNLIDKLSKLDVQSIPIAVTLNRWTEDGFHGDNHRTQAKWIPEIPMEAKSPGDQIKWIAIQNAYIKDPSAGSLWDLLDGVDLLNGARFTSGGVSERLAKEKYRSVLLLQHMMRHNEIRFPDLSITKNLSRFSVWETAQVSNVMARGCADSGSPEDPYPCWKYPSSFYKKMGTDRTRILNDVVKMNFPWLIAGWLLDPTLQLTEGGDAQISHLHTAAEKHLFSFNDNPGLFAQLPLHDVYFSFVRLVKSIEAADERFPTGPHLDMKPVKSCWANVGAGINQWVKDTLPALNRQIAAGNSPAISSGHRQLILAVVTNLHRAALYLIKDRHVNSNPACSEIKPIDGYLTLLDVVNKIPEWQDGNQAPDTAVTDLANELKNLIK